MPTQCEIRFDNEPERVYYGGQLLSGRVALSLTKEKTVRGTSMLQPEIHKQTKNVQVYSVPAFARINAMSMRTLERRKMWLLLSALELLLWFANVYVCTIGSMRPAIRLSGVIVIK